jgi:lipopolysaccharide/colanic/teichoic acid biosynthesis glycosyltransferase
MKRLADILVAIILLTIAFPFLLVVALMIFFHYFKSPF